MGVKKEYHRQGIGKKLFKKAYDYCFGRYEFLQVKTVEMGTYKEYDCTNRFYKSLGFKEFDVLDLWDENNPL